jgi:hypothetical protein
MRRTISFFSLYFNPPSPSRDWHSAASAAIGFVAKREGHLVSKNEVTAMELFTDNR